MKNLESIKGSKFELTTEEVNSVNGGVAPGVEYSRDFSYTVVGDTITTDEKVIDWCIVF